VIDGIEVWKAIHHVHDHKGQLQELPATPVTDEEVAKAVDDVMKDIDLNNDGMIDYSEYVKKVELWENREEFVKIFIKFKNGTVKK